MFNGKWAKGEIVLTVAIVLAVALLSVEEAWPGEVYRAWRCIAWMMGK